MKGSSISRRTLIAGASSFAGASVLFGLVADNDGATQKHKLNLSGKIMGTTYSVTLSAAPPDFDSDALRSDIDLILQGVDERMSTYRPESELSCFNRSRSTDWFPVSPDTLGVVEAGLATGRLSSGAFDITVGPAVDRWGFGPSRRRDPLDGSEQDLLRDRVDYRRIAVSRTRGAVKKAQAHAAIDLSGIAKGFAVDRVAKHVEAAGIADFLVEIGGEFRARGVASRGSPWKLGVEKPVAGEIGIHRVLELHDGALATSGDYRFWFQRDGERFSHIIDPRTGRPIGGKLTSVSVIADTAMRADALSTALMALDQEAGWALVRREAIAALFIARETGGFTDRASPEFERHLVV